MKGTNKYVWVVRDVPKAEKAGIVIPRQGLEKPHTGTIISIGSLVDDKDIKAGKGKKAIFHKTVGQEIIYQDATYLILQQHEIIGVE
jgi:co-chaperonin GroES (HSP10)